MSVKESATAVFKSFLRRARTVKESEGAMLTLSPIFGIVFGTSLSQCTTLVERRKSRSLKYKFEVSDITVFENPKNSNLKTLEIWNDGENILESVTIALQCIHDDYRATDGFKEETERPLKLTLEKLRPEATVQVYLQLPRDVLEPRVQVYGSLGEACNYERDLVCRYLPLAFTDLAWLVFWVAITIGIALLAIPALKTITKPDSFLDQNIPFLGQLRENIIRLFNRKS